MRIALVVVTALTVAVAGSVAHAGHDAAAGRATLKLVDTAPLKLRGARFAAREPVRVTFSAHQIRKTKRVVASARGSFVVRFPGVVVDRCHALTVVAVGSRGSEARLSVKAQPQCPPPL